MRPPRYFGLIPAAGTGSRMGAATPKQYLMIDGKPMLWHAVRALSAADELERVFVVLDAQDAHWSGFDWSAFGSRLAALRCGGASRAESVRNGLRALAQCAAEGDWVLVHDAARPCLSAGQLRELIRTLSADPVGGLLAVPIPDTIKRAGQDERVAATVPREGMWAAQTPQMFRCGMLRAALEADTSGTDEAQAIEALGHAPRLVRGDATNLKVTYPLDARLAEWILRARGEA